MSPGLGSLGEACDVGVPVPVDHCCQSRRLSGGSTSAVIRDRRPVQERDRAVVADVGERSCRERLVGATGCRDRAAACKRRTEVDERETLAGLSGHVQDGRHVPRRLQAGELAADRGTPVDRRRVGAGTGATGATRAAGATAAAPLLLRGACERRVGALDVLPALAMSTGPLVRRRLAMCLVRALVMCGGSAGHGGRDYTCDAEANGEDNDESGCKCADLVTSMR